MFPSSTQGHVQKGTCGLIRITKTYCAHVPGTAVSAFYGLIPLILKTTLESYA